MSEAASELASKRCAPCEGGEQPLGPEEIAHLLKQLQGWSHTNGKILKTFRFPNYWHTMAFVNATAWISHREDHHPDLQVSYNQCQVAYHTHTVQGLSENDFICAAKVDALFRI